MTAPVPSALVLLAATLLRIPARRIRALARGADEYPAGLRDLPAPPPFLIVRGSLPRACGPAGTQSWDRRSPMRSPERWREEAERGLRRQRTRYRGGRKGDPSRYDDARAIIANDRPTVNPFQAFDLSKASAIEDIDALPFGVIVVDRQGTILEYNAYESALTGFARERVLERNFFRDVAPCTALKEFQGRFGEFLSSRDTSIEPFEFVFPFARGAQKVTVLFVRLNFESDRATICVIRRPDDGTDGPTAPRH